MQFNIRMFLTAEVLIFPNKKQLILVHRKKKQNHIIYEIPY